MGRPCEKTHDVVMANVGQWFAAWEVGGTYIDVFGSNSSYRRVKAALQKGETDPGSVAVACINTTGDETGATPAERQTYVRKELEAWVTDQGDDYAENDYR